MKVDNEKINSLLESIRKNDLFALGELMEAITPKIAKIACAILKDPQLAEDVVDEVLIALVQNIHSFKSDKNMNGWLNAVTINKSIDCLRKRKNEFLPGDDFLSAIPAAITEDKLAEKLQIVDVLKKMEPLQRQLLVDRVLNGETLFSLAKKYNLTVKQVRIRLKKANAAFAALYSERED
ncbi:MAG: sigma-70 family RNA polymerase sigma factor [Firmicutes bacterium]|nr:sigma-70 family RNA polymerase sigma factor [Clostridia bacterium]MBS5022650.1 sigma-70 family RNA polymerase sigma factor [Bacillota bacterium]